MVGVRVDNLYLRRECVKRDEQKGIQCEGWRRNMYMYTSMRDDVHGKF